MKHMVLCWLLLTCTCTLTYLINCILDYGPVYAFWLVSFERFNGFLGSYPTNKRSIEMQMCRRFIQGQMLKTTLKPSTFTGNDKFGVFFNNFDQKGVSALADTISHYDLDSDSAIAVKMLVRRCLLRFTDHLSRDYSFG